MLVIAIGILAGTLLIKQGTDFVNHADEILPVELPFPKGSSYCIPRPPCLDDENPCKLMGNFHNWCPKKPRVTPAPGVSGVPSLFPSPSCRQRPACLDAHPPCEIPEPIGGWCPPVF